MEEEKFEIFNLEEDKEKNESKPVKDNEKSNAFVNDLPSWDLTPPYETLRRNDSDDVL